MRAFRTRLAPVALSMLLANAAFASTVLAQPRPDRRTAPALETTTVASTMDAQATRRSLMEVLEKHPPSVARVLKIDPSLMHNETYLAAYPNLRDFLAGHPEIPPNASFYLEQIYVDGNWRPRSPQLEIMQGVLAGLAGFTAFGVVLGTLTWAIRTILDQRRWSRLSKIQAEVHTKLMDRFSSNDELLAYVQTPSGRRFLESGPSPLPELGPAMAAPFSRILWSVQIGSVLLVTGLGLLFVSGRPSWPEAREVFYFTGTIGAAVGAGFIVSAAVSYGLSRRLGLLERPSTSNA
jgi:hypothetical protein